jgi:hypothetical protein
MTGPINSVANGIRVNVARFNKAASDVADASATVADEVDAVAQPGLVDAVVQLATAKAATVASLNAARVVNEALMDIVRATAPLEEPG